MKLICWFVTLGVTLQFGHVAIAQVSGLSYSCSSSGVDVFVTEYVGILTPGAIIFYDLGNSSERVPNCSNFVTVTNSTLPYLLVTLPVDGCGEDKTEMGLDPIDVSYANVLYLVLFPWSAEVMELNIQCSYTIPGEPVEESDIISEFRCYPDNMTVIINQTHAFGSDVLLPEDILIEYSLAVSGCLEATSDLTETEVTVFIPLAGCGTTVEDYGLDQLIYRNSILAKVVYTAFHNTTMDKDRLINLTCTYNRTARLEIALNPFDIIAEQDIKKYGVFEFIVGLYRDGNRLDPSGGPVEVALGERLVVEVNVTANLSLHLSYCWATPYIDGEIYQDPYYPLILSGCDSNPRSEALGLGYICTDGPVQRFGVNIFRFLPPEVYQTVWIYCDVMVCNLNADSSSCDCPDCVDNNRRRRRASDQRGFSTHDDGSRVYEVSVGPIVKVDREAGKQDTLGKEDETEFPITALITGLVSGFVVIAVIVIAVILVLRKNKQINTLTMQGNIEIPEIPSQRSGTDMA